MPSIAELLLEKARQQGQMWNNIGRDIAAVPATIAQAQEQGRRSALEKIQVQNAQDVQRGQQTLDQALQSVQPQGPTEPGQAPLQPTHPYLDDQGLIDPTKVQQLFNANGLAHVAPDILDRIDKQNSAITNFQKTQQQLKTEQAVLLGRTAHTALGLMDSAGFDFPTATTHAAQPLIATKVLKPEDVQGVIQQGAQLPPDQQRVLLSSLIDNAAQLAPTKKLGKDEAEYDIFNRPIASNIVKPPPTRASLAQSAAGGDAQAQAALDFLKPPPAPEASQTKDVLLDGKPSVLTWEPKSRKWLDAGGQEVSNPAERIKPIPPASATINPTLIPSGDALTMAARRYLATGELPSMGMGQAGAAARVAVMNEAAKIDPKASLALNKATFEADRKNLDNLQKTEGTLSAFENTAGKNLDQFLSLASKIPDTGVPWLNTPIRSVNAKLLGSADQAAFNAARDVALREIARVTNDPKLSGVLSDSARHEVSALNPANATFAQIQAVAKVLKQDMANVHSSLRQQISTVKSGIGQTPDQQPQTSDPLGIR